MLGGGRAGLGNSRTYRDLAKLRKDLKTSGKDSKMGDTWKKQDPHMQKLMDNSCGRKKK